MPTRRSAQRKSAPKPKLRKYEQARVLGGGSSINGQMATLDQTEGDVPVSGLDDPIAVDLMADDVVGAAQPGQQTFGDLQQRFRGTRHRPFTALVNPWRVFS